MITRGTWPTDSVRTLGQFDAAMEPRALPLPSRGSSRVSPDRDGGAHEVSKVRPV
jgi:hypothetical protein